MPSVYGESWKRDKKDEKGLNMVVAVDFLSIPIPTYI